MRAVVNQALIGPTMGRFVVDAVNGGDLPFGCKSPIQGGLYRWAAPTVTYKTLRAGDFGS